MRFTTLFAAVTAAVSGVASLSIPIGSDFDLFGIIGFNLTASNNYNSPFPPWHPEGQPGWYYGSIPFLFPDIPCLNGILCLILDFFPYALHCPKKVPPPPPNDGYFPTFKNLTCATQAADFQTFGLVDTEADCKAMCNSVSGCNFVNAYHDVNGKGGSTQLTCSLFTSCHDASTADNCGGQTQSSGLVDFIIDSDGFCKNGQKIADADATTST